MINDDDELLARLRAIADEADGPPELVTANARAALSTRRLNDELAELVADSDAALEAVVRDDERRLRLLSFQTATVSVELQLDEVGDRVSLRGQVAGASGEVEVETAGERRTAPIDPRGWFVLDDLPSGAIRLRLQAEDGSAVTTSWMST